MKPVWPKLLAVLLSTVLLFTVLLLPVVAQTTTQSEIDATLSATWTDIVAFQTLYYGTYGTYLQTRWSHTSAPTQTTTADNLNDKPDDATHTSATMYAMAGLTTTTRYRMKIDVYTSPDGDGFVLILEYEEDSHLWQRHINYGPEPRGAAWFMLVEDEF